MHTEQLHVLQKPIEIPPRWRIVPVDAQTQNADLHVIQQNIQPAGLAKIPIYIHHRGAFGTGAHETTRLCLQALATFSRPWVLQAQKQTDNSQKYAFEMLDFGSGTGILSIGAALLGALSYAVEIDPVGILNAQENAQLNHVPDALIHTRSLVIPDKPAHSFDLVIANILQPVLLEFAEQLKAHVKTGGWLVLSGLLATDVPIITAKYQWPHPQVFRAGEWCLVAWRKEQDM